MNVNPTVWDNPARLLRFDYSPGEKENEGPIALLRSMMILAAIHKTKLILCTLIGVGVGIVYAHSLPQIYTATATLLLEPRRQAAVSGQDTAAQGLDSNRADSELQIIRSERLLTVVFDSLFLQTVAELGPRQPGGIDRLLDRLKTAIGDSLTQEIQSTAARIWVPEKTARAVEPTSGSMAKEGVDARQAAFSNFEKHLDVRRVGQSYVIEIDYSSSDPALTARVANAAASAYILQSVEFKEQMAIAGTEALQWRLNALAAQVAAATQAMKQGNLPIIPTPDADARVIGAAMPPLSPSSPKRTLIIALGGVLGLLGGFTILALNLAFDRRISGSKALMRETGVPCLGSLPEISNRSRSGWYSDSEKAFLVIRQPRSQYAAAVRDLRTSIEIASAGVRSERSVVIGVASWDASSGASVLCSSLAQLISHSGRHVTLFKAAVDESGHAVNNAEPPIATNLADILISNVKIENVVFAEDDGGIAALPFYSTNAGSNLFADFRDRRVSRIVDAARANGDVLLDLPPLSASTDALALAIHADIVIVVVTAGKTTTEEVVDTLHLLNRAGANIVGTVINKAKA
jgi:succinoglycan biosynthesis transport protein ExoP